MCAKRYDRYSKNDNVLSASEARRQSIVKPILVPPGKGKSFFLGVFEPDMPRPEFTVLLKPNSDLMTKVREDLTIKDDGSYIAVLHLHNFGSLPCHVIVERKQSDHDATTRGHR